ncbi:hypothetical protein C7S15_5266 [Burkholderia cepacia]|nr:hypothetical protein [Burkholderia cepacia]
MTVLWANAPNEADRATAATTAETSDFMMTSDVYWLSAFDTMS